MKTKYEIEKAHQELERINLMYDVANWCIFYNKSIELFNAMNVGSVIPEDTETYDITQVNYSWKASNIVFYDNIVKQETQKWFSKNQGKLAQLKADIANKFHKANDTAGKHAAEAKALENKKTEDKVGSWFNKGISVGIIVLGVILFGSSGTAIWYYMTQKQTWWLITLIVLVMLFGIIIFVKGISKFKECKRHYNFIKKNRVDELNTKRGKEISKYNSIIEQQYKEAVDKLMASDKQLQKNIATRYNNVLKFEQEVDDKVEELASIKKQLYKMTEIPEKYCTEEVVPVLFDLLKNKRANTIKELINLYEQTEWQNEVIYNLENIGRVLVRFNNNVMSELRRMNSTLDDIKDIRSQQLAAQTRQIAASQRLSTAITDFNSTLNTKLVSNVW